MTSALQGLHLSTRKRGEDGASHLLARREFRKSIAGLLTLTGGRMLDSACDLWNTPAEPPTAAILAASLNGGPASRHYFWKR